jgi:hypothetical protein
LFGGGETTFVLGRGALATAWPINARPGAYIFGKRLCNLETTCRLQRYIIIPIQRTSIFSLNLAIFAA